MTPATLDLMLTVGSVWGVALLCGVGVAVLPWSEGEQQASWSAWAALPGLVGRLPTGRVLPVGRSGAQAALSTTR